MKLSIVAAAALASGLANATYPITGNGVHCRTGPGTSYGVKTSYPKGHSVTVTCQTSGTNIDGDAIWDKTSDNCYVADYYVKTGSSGYVMGKCGSSGGSGGNLPHLDSTQTAHARKIIAEAKKEGLGHQGCVTGITTALTESSMLMYANNAVPASLKYPHDRVGSDHDSIGLFQQRAMYYPNIASDMDAAKSAAQFFAIMKKISGWKTMDVGTLCQKVQRSAYPTAYNKQVGIARDICTAGGE